MAYKERTTVKNTPGAFAVLKALRDYLRHKGVSVGAKRCKTERKTPYLLLPKGYRIYVTDCAEHSYRGKPVLHAAYLIRDIKNDTVENVSFMQFQEARRHIYGWIKEMELGPVPFQSSSTTDFNRYPLAKNIWWHPKDLGQNYRPKEFRPSPEYYVN